MLEQIDQEVEAVEAGLVELEVEEEEEVGDKAEEADLETKKQRLYNV